MPTNRADELLILKELVIQTFDRENWITLGIMTGFEDNITRHDRLLRSLSWSDPDYPGHALTMLSSIARSSDDNFSTMKRYIDSVCGENVSSVASASRILRFTPAVFEVPNEDPDENLLSVMMPFGAQFSAVYEAIENAAKNSFMRCERADNVWNHTVIIQDIFAMIFRSNIVVCDFTDRNPNVFYETGIAHTLGKQVIPITQSKNDVPFDLQSHRYLLYLNNAQGIADMQSRLSDRIATLLQQPSP